MKTPEPYSYVRYTWWTIYSIKHIIDQMKSFTIRIPAGLQGESISLNQRDIFRLEVKADTLVAYLAPSKAVMSQKESKPFTKSDMKLREIVLELYPHVNPGPFPFYYRKEPKFLIDQAR